MGAFEDNWAEFEQEVGPMLVGEMAARAPVDTGVLSSTHDWRDNDGKLEVFSDDPRGPIAAYVIRGTQPHPIEPTGPWPLHFIASDGTEVWTYHVDHPGTQPNPYNQDAWEAVKEEVVHTFADKVGRRYALALLNPWKGATIE